MIRCIKLDPRWGKRTERNRSSRTDRRLGTQGAYDTRGGGGGVERGKIENRLNLCRGLVWQHLHMKSRWLRYSNKFDQCVTRLVRPAGLGVQPSAAALETFNICTGCGAAPHGHGVAQVPPGPGEQWNSSGDTAVRHGQDKCPCRGCTARGRQPPRHHAPAGSFCGAQSRPHTTTPPSPPPTPTSRDDQGDECLMITEKERNSHGHVSGVAVVASGSSSW